MDFRNESLNSMRMQQLLDSCDTPKAKEMVIPKVYLDLTTRYHWLFVRDFDFRLANSTSCVLVADGGGYQCGGWFCFIT